MILILNNRKFITNSLGLHLFFMRIMKEHMFFIQASFTPQNFGLSEKAAFLREEASNFLAKVVSVSKGNISKEDIASEDIVTDYTVSAEEASSYYTNIPIDTSITIKEQSFKNITYDIKTINTNEVIELNKEAHALVTQIINYKTTLLEQVLKCSLFTLNYPLLIDHILREAKKYLEQIENIQNQRDFNNSRELIQQEIFWNNIMAEHSKFIRGLLDPTEEDLIETANMFANKFDELNLLAKMAQNNVESLSNITYQNLEEAEKIKAFKQQGTQGLINCKIKSIILPLLADHVLREANHYIKILKMYESSNMQKEPY